MLSQVQIRLLALCFTDKEMFEKFHVAPLDIEIALGDREYPPIPDLGKLPAVLELLLSSSNISLEELENKIARLK